MRRKPTQTQGRHAKTPQRPQPDVGLKPRTLLLWSDGANHCSTVPPILANQKYIKKITARNKKLLLLCEMIHNMAYPAKTPAPLPFSLSSVCGHIKRVILAKLVSFDASACFPWLFDKEHIYTFCYSALTRRQIKISETLYCTMMISLADVFSHLVRMVLWEAFLIFSLMRHSSRTMSQNLTKEQ